MRERSRGRGFECSGAAAVEVLSGGGGGVDGAAARAPRRAARGEAAEEEEPSAKALGIAMKCVTFAFGKFRRNVQQVCRRFPLRRQFINSKAQQLGFSAITLP